MTPLTIGMLTWSVPWVILLLGLAIVAWIDPYISATKQRLFLLICALLLVLMIAEDTEYMISNGQARDAIRICASAYGYAVRPFLLVLFLQILFPERPQWPLRLVAGINALVYIVSIFNGVAMRMVDNRFQRGPLNRLCLIVSVLLMLDMTAMLIRHYRYHAQKEIVITAGNAILIAMGIYMDSSLAQLHPLNFLTIAITISCVFYYILLHLQLSREHEEETIKNLRAEQRIQIMISQIQPHFVYNTLTTIQALCRTDPERASETVEWLGQYLRKNIDSLDQPQLIPFEKEMEHTRTYADIERLRFPSIEITYDLQDMAFVLPALTIQPLVENAIRHGVRIRSRGEIVIRSQYKDGRHVMTIWDNGTGFDVDQALRADSTHIGLRNVRDRVEQMCGGTVDIQSKRDEGTLITISLPEKK